MKKSLFGILLFMSFLLLSPLRTEASSEIYMGRYPSGLDAYLILSTLIFDSAEYVDFKTTVKATDYATQTYYINYHFWRDRGIVYFSNSQGFHGVVDSSTPVEQNIWNYGQSVP